MSTTEAATAAITLTGLGPPDGPDPWLFADVLPGPARLAEELRDRLAIGELLGPAGPPALRRLLRCAAVTEELAGLRGQFATLVDRYGARTAAEASRRLLALVPAYGTAAALIRPFAPRPGTVSGLTLDLPTRLLDKEFGRGRVTRFEDLDLPAALTHEPTRRFLRDVGLPGADGPLTTLAEYYADEEEDAYAPDPLPCDAGHLIRLGRLVEGNSLVVDGTTGAVLVWSEPEATLYALNTDVSTLAATLWLLHHERTADACRRLAEEMPRILSALDWHHWTEFLRDADGGRTTKV